MRYCFTYIFFFLLLTSTFSQNANCDVFELLQGVTPNYPNVPLSNDLQPVPCGFWVNSTTYINECSPCGHKIADDLCVNTPNRSICELDGFQGSTGGYTSDNIGGNLLGFCNGAGTIENNLFVGFTAQTNEIELLFTVDNCNQSSNQFGVQFAIIETNCFDQVTTMQGPNPCNFNGLYNNSDIIHATNLVPGNPYFVMFDGFAGDICEVSLEVLSGIGTPSMNVISVSEDLCPDPNIPGEPEASVVVELDPFWPSSDLYFYWLDPNEVIIYEGPASQINGSFFTSSLGASYFAETGIYNVQIVDQGSCCGTCVDLSLMIVSPNLNIIENPIPDNTYTALYELQSASEVPVNGNVTFQAGSQITLMPGFKVNVNADFKAEIEVCQ